MCRVVARSAPLDTDRQAGIDHARRIPLVAATGRAVCRLCWTQQHDPDANICARKSEILQPFLMYDPVSF